MNRFAKTRSSLDLTQEKMAALLGVSFVSVNRWENGHAVPMRTVLDLYDALDTALHRGKTPDVVRRAAEKPRPVFLRQLFYMAYPP